MKKTAVEWLIDQLEIFATEKEMNIINQAKEMEKQQIIDSRTDIYTTGDLSAEEYYIKIYKQ